jgi:anti-sigma B factor antagonist
MSVDSGHMGRRTAPLKVTLEFHQHGFVVASVSGELDVASTGTLDSELSTALAAGRCECLVLDLAGVEVLDSTGLRALWTIRQSLREIGARLLLRRPSATVVHVLEAAGLTAMFDLA